MDKNPYQPPESEINNQSDFKIPESSKAWKAYFFFIMFISVLGLAFLFSDVNSGVAELLSILLFIPSTFAFYGYVYRKKFLSANFWYPFFFIYLIWSILYGFVSQVDQTAGLSTNEYYFNVALGWIISIPFYIALYVYGTKSFYIWKNSDLNSRED